MRNCFPAPTTKNLCKFYIPLSGAVSHGLYGMLYMRPSVVPDQCPVSADCLTNGLFFHSAIGIGLYLYNMDHLKDLPVMRKAIFATYGTALFSFGSVFLFGSIKMATDSNTFRLVMALLASGALMCVGKEYFDHVNQLAAGNPKEQ
ncbi:hypothetical protein M514_01894 [Trichuris suis]|uniref:Uncharacterized protein n=1 Tax=Trichuris suis TaxID=68888 RepID=A0A085MJI7_9BILA|nr:hypothetical protein M513_01894 [Trichuris suis]KFD72773.1 hypothetical protein M514_01894 [Trichuris suis]